MNLSQNLANFHLLIINQDVNRILYVFQFHYARQQFGLEGMTEKNN